MYRYLHICANFAIFILLNIKRTDYGRTYKNH